MLVENQQVDVGHIGDDQCKRLPLSAAERADLGIQAFFQPHAALRQHLAVDIDAGAADGGRQPVAPLFVVRQRHILKDGEVAAGTRLGVLKNSADVRGAAVFRKVRNIVAVHDDFAGVDRQRAAEQVQHGGLAAAVGADDRDKFAVVHGQIEVVKQRDRIRCARIEGLTDVFVRKHFSYLRSP